MGVFAKERCITVMYVFVDQPQLIAEDIQTLAHFFSLPHDQDNGLFLTKQRR